MSLDSVKNLLLEWKVKGTRKKKRVVWRLALICLFWCIWRERNHRTCQEEELSDQSLRKLFTRSLLEWSQQVLRLDNPFFFFEFLGVLNGD